MLEGASPLNSIYVIKARRASDFIIYYFFFILFVGLSPTNYCLLFNYTSSVLLEAIHNLMHFCFILL